MARHTYDDVSPFGDDAKKNLKVTSDDVTTSDFIGQFFGQFLDNFIGRQSTQLFQERVKLNSRKMKNGGPRPPPISEFQKNIYKYSNIRK